MLHAGRSCRYFAWPPAYDSYNWKVNGGPQKTKNSYKMRAKLFMSGSFSVHKMHNVRYAGGPKIFQ